jgi:putative endonuclease
MSDLAKIIRPLFSKGGRIVHRYVVYIMASRSRVLYIGMTNDLARRIGEHKSRQGGDFTSRYLVDRLVYCERFTDVREAISREKQLKGWLRARKVALIEATNPEWRDLPPI